VGVVECVGDTVSDPEEQWVVLTEAVVVALLLLEVHTLTVGE
jgi:hypothetical protein